jgi:hypothetical protein
LLCSVGNLEDPASPRVIDDPRAIGVDDDPGPRAIGVDDDPGPRAIGVVDDPAPSLDVNEEILVDVAWQRPHQTPGAIDGPDAEEFGRELRRLLCSQRRRFRSIWLDVLRPKDLRHCAPLGDELTGNLACNQQAGFATSRLALPVVASLEASHHQ